MTTTRYIAFVLLGGCSALIEPDVSRLGDAGGGGRDAGDHDAGDHDAGDVCPPSCDDDIACTTDACEEGECAHTPDDGACAGDERCSPVLGCVPAVCARDEECDDGVFCNGVERCVEGGPGTGCVDGDPVVCPEDGAACSTARCDEASDACGFELDHAMCADDIGCTTDACDPAASDDGCAHEPDDSLCGDDFCTVGARCDASSGCTGGTRRPCADDTPCTTDVCSDVLAMCVNELRDDDTDGYGAESYNGPGGPTVVCGGDDCDDDDDTVHPGATELCNNRVDEDCDGMIDEECPVEIPEEDCGMPPTLSLVGSTSATVSRSFAGLADDYQTNAYCDTDTGGRDAVYSVELPAGIYDVTIDTLGSVGDTVLAVGFTCDATAFGGVCNDDIDTTMSNRASRIWVHRYGSNTGRSRLYVLVDAFDGSEMRDFTLNVRRSAVAPDTCSTGGGSFPLDISGGGGLVGFNPGFVSTQRGSCSPGLDFDSEAIFRVRRPTSGSVNFEVFSLEFQPTIYLREAPCGSGTEDGCVVGAPVGGGLNGATLRRSIGTELHYLFVDGGPGSYAVYYEPY